MEKFSKLNEDIDKEKEKAENAVRDKPESMYLYPVYKDYQNQIESYKNKANYKSFKESLKNGEEFKNKHIINDTNLTIKFKSNMNNSLIIINEIITNVKLILKEDIKNDFDIKRERNNYGYK